MVLEGNELMVVLESMKDIIKNASLGQPLLLIIDQLLKCNLKKLSKYFSDQIESVLSRSLSISTSKKICQVCGGIFIACVCLLR